MDIGQSPLFIAAPMVRYSKLPFRRLVSKYGCDIAYTPMIYAKCFVASEKCRLVEFTSDDNDWPIVQFAANKPEEFASAAELVYGKCLGVDLNCGCPKRDTTKEGCGAKLLENPELVAEIVRQCRARISDPDFSISMKIRINYPLERTVDFCRKVEYAGVSRIAVHGRTPAMRCEKPDYAAISQIKASTSVPIFANGDCKSYDEALEIAKITRVDGVMAANGLLANPALFGGHRSVPMRCISDWLELEEQEPGIPFELFHRILMFMLRRILSKPERLIFNELDTSADVRAYINKFLL